MIVSYVIFRFRPEPLLTRAQLRDVKHTADMKKFNTELEMELQIVNL